MLYSMRVRRGEKGAYGALEREISLENQISSVYRKSLLRVFLEVLHVLLVIFRSITGSRIFTIDVKYIVYVKI